MVISIDGGAAALDTAANKAAITAAVVDTFAAGSSGLNVSAAVTDLTDATSRRLNEQTTRDHSVGQPNREGSRPVLNDTAPAVNSVDDRASSSPAGSRPGVDTTRRELTASAVVVSYTVFVAENHNAAVGNFDACKVGSVCGTRDVAATPPRHQPPLPFGQ